MRRTIDPADEETEDAAWPAILLSRNGVAMTVLIAGNILAWLWAIVTFAHQPALLGASALAYLFGLRHALDADHIAAIDNVVRKFVQNGGGKLRSVGFFFSLGHSTVVLVATWIIAGSAAGAVTDGQLVRHLGGDLGTLASSLFLIFIGLTNLRSLGDTVAAMAKLRRARGNGATGDGSSQAVDGGGRFLGPVLRLVTRPWHMYPVGVIFALAFDTATEVALLGISATNAAHSPTLLSILVFPALFAAGMCLADTADSLLVSETYAWAVSDPSRRLRFNFVLTAVSVSAALMIGVTQLLVLTAEEFGWHSAIWDVIGELRNESSKLGIVLVAVFGLIWFGQMIWARWSAGRGAAWSSTVEPLG